MCIAGPEQSLVLLKIFLIFFSKNDSLCYDEQNGGERFFLHLLQVIEHWQVTLHISDILKRHKTSYTLSPREVALHMVHRERRIRYPFVRHVHRHICWNNHTITIVESLHNKKETNLYYYHYYPQHFHPFTIIILIWPCSALDLNPDELYKNVPYLWPWPDIMIKTLRFLISLKPYILDTQKNRLRRGRKSCR